MPEENLRAIFPTPILIHNYSEMSDKERLKAILETPVLFFSTGEECRKAYLTMLESGIACEFRAAAEDTPPPLLLVGYTRYEGINEIRKYIEEHKNA